MPVAFMQHATDMSGQRHEPKQMFLEQLFPLVDCRGGFPAAEIIRPGDGQAKQELVVDQDGYSRRADRSADGSEIAFLDRVRDIRADAGERQLEIFKRQPEATTKNQPPDMDIIVFQIRPGSAVGASEISVAPGG